MAGDEPTWLKVHVEKQTKVVQSGPMSAQAWEVDIFSCLLSSWSSGAFVELDSAFEFVSCVFLREQKTPHL